MPAAPAAAAPTWLDPADLSAAGQDADAPQVAIDPGRNAVAVWMRSNGSHTIVQAAARATGGGWQGPVDISLKGRDADQPQVAVDGTGDAVAVWRRYDGSRLVIQSARRPAGGGWGLPVNLSAEGQNAEEPQVAVDPAGNAVAVWARYNGLHYIVQAAHRPAGGGWEAGVDLSAAGQNAEAPQVAVDAAGNAVAVWRRYDGSRYVIQSASRPAGGGWSEPVDLSAAGQNAEAPQVAVNAAGHAVAVWVRSDGGKDIAQAAVRPAGGAWGAASDLSAAGQSAEGPQVAVDPAGNAVAVWARQGSPTTVIQSSRLPAGGSWDAPVPLSTAGESAKDAQVSVDPAGNAVAAWSATDGSPRTVQTATRPAGGGWLPLEVISVVGQNAGEPQVALDPSGDGIAVWARENGVNTIAQAIGYDRAGPSLGSPSIPAAGTIKQPISFSISPFDAWSAIGPISWTFGDGEGAAGGAVSHSFANAGTYQVGVAVSDALGNGNAAGGSIRIYPKPSASRNVRLKGRNALLRLRCPSPAGCQGLLRLIVGHKFVRNGRKVGRRLPVGRTEFAIPGAATSTVPVPISRKGRGIVRKAGRRGVKAQLTGPGVKHRIVVLFPPRPRARSAHSHRR